VRRLISRLVLLSALVGALSLGANSTLNHPTTADMWPNPLVTDTGPSTDPLVGTSDPWPSPLTFGGARVASDSVVEGV